MKSYQSYIKSILGATLTLAVTISSVNAANLLMTAGCGKMGKAIFTGYGNDMPMTLKNTSGKSCGIEVFTAVCKSGGCKLSEARRLGVSERNNHKYNVRWESSKDVNFDARETLNLKNDKLVSYSNNNNYIRICLKNKNTTEGCTVNSWQKG